MLNNGNKKNCDFMDEIVSYMYDEINSPDRQRFEMHLADCGACTDEFAAISNARFSVFEWQKNEFADLPTPEFVIPYESTSMIVETHEPVGFTAAVRAWLSSLSLPVAVAAGLLVCLGLALLTFTLLGRQDQEVANVNVPALRPETNPPVAPVADPERVQIPAGIEVAKPQPVKATFKQAKRPMTHASPNPNIDRPANNFAQTPQIRRAPMLSSYEDNDDSSLRLADLFDEVGG